MKRIVLQMAIAAAAVVAAASTASAQSLKAEIAFPFDAAGARMQPGTYSVTLGHLGSGAASVRFYEADQHRSAIALPMVTEAPAQGRSASVILTFACTGGNCVLASLRDSSATVYRFAAGKRTAETRIATVVLRPDHGE